MSRRVTVEELQQSLDEAIQGVADRGDEIVVERNGQPLAAVVPLGEYEALKRSRDRLAADRAKLGSKRSYHGWLHLSRAFGRD